MSRFLATLLFSFGVVAFHAQQKAPEKFVVPPAVEQKFVLENPEATATWRKDGAFYKALFVNPVNNLGYILVYTENGTIVRREKELEGQEYPAMIAEYHEKKFPGEGLSVWSSTDSTGNILFYSQKNNRTFWFDREGRVLNQVADSANTAASR